MRVPFKGDMIVTYLARLGGEGDAEQERDALAQLQNVGVVGVDLEHTRLEREYCTQRQVMAVLAWDRVSARSVQCREASKKPCQLSGNRPAKRTQRAGCQNNTMYR